MLRRAVRSVRLNRMKGGNLVVIAVLLLAGSALLSGCAPSLKQIGAGNLGNVQDVKVGDFRAQVVSRMGSTTVVAQHGQEVPSPYRSKKFDNSEGTPTEILYYYTGSQGVDKEQGHTISNNELTPIVLEWSAVVGKGWKFLQENRDKYPQAFQTDQN